jgi:hypothetical protein
MRNLFALSAGVQKTVYWYLPALPAAGGERYNVMSLMYGKIGLLGLENGVPKTRTVSADAFERMAVALKGVEQVKQIELPATPSIYLFQVDRAGRKPVYVVWEKRDAFSGEDAPPVSFEWQWSGKKPKAQDALGQSIPLQLTNGRISLQVSVTPIFISE